VIFCNPISDLEFFFHLSQRSVGLLEVYTPRKAATFNPYFSLTNADFKLDSFAVTGATGTGVNLMSIPAISWWSIAHPIVFIAYIYMLQNLPAK
jgi:hypothetical protein